MTEEKKQSHWNELVEELGVQPTEDVAQESENKDDAASSIPAIDAKRSSRELPSPSNADWQDLAESLGLEVSEPAPATAADVAREVPRPEPAETAEAESEDEWDRETSDSVAEKIAESVWTEDSPYDEVETAAEEDLESGEILSIDREEPPTEAGEPGSSAERASEEDEDEPRGRRRRRRRRRGRARPAAEETEPEPTSHFAGVEALEEATDFEILETPAEEAELPDREEAVQEASEPADETTGEESGDDEGGERPRRRRRRRSRRSGRRGAEEAGESDTGDAVRSQSESEEAHREEDGEPSDDDGDDESMSLGRSPHRNIPTWDEAVGTIITKNMESRSNSTKGSSSGRRGRGGGRGRRRSGRK